ncbi:MAG: helix-turn-helix transcriptional regulator [Clostridia bacterium]|nr:helix-turn-helix transcriptional regulator [Clostridia bacterium]
MKNKFSERLREARIQNKLGQAQLAELCNVKQSCVSKWERGITLPDAEMLFTICEVLHESADFLLGLKDY